MHRRKKKKIAGDEDTFKIGGVQEQQNWNQILPPWLAPGLVLERLDLWTLNPAIAVQIRARPSFIVMTPGPFHDIFEKAPTGD